jgi:hypothetical protein
VGSCQEEGVAVRDHWLDHSQLAMTLQLLRAPHLAVRDLKQSVDVMGEPTTETLGRVDMRCSRAQVDTMTVARIVLGWCWSSRVLHRHCGCLEMKESGSRPGVGSRNSKLAVAPV